MNILRIIALLLTIAFFGIAGVMHFTNDSGFVSIVPPYIPYPMLMVYISGVAEVAGALGLLLGWLLKKPALSQAAGIGLIILCICVFPANVHMALNPDQFTQIDPLRLWLRLPLQPVIIAIIYFGMQLPKIQQQQIEQQAQPIQS